MLGKASPPSPFCGEATSYIPSLTHLELFNNNSTISWTIVINVEKLQQDMEDGGGMGCDGGERGSLGSGGLSRPPLAGDPMVTHP